MVYWWIWVWEGVGAISLGVDSLDVVLLSGITIWLFILLLITFVTRGLTYRLCWLSVVRIVLWVLCETCDLLMARSLSLLGRGLCGVLEAWALVVMWLIWALERSIGFACFSMFRTAISLYRIIGLVGRSFIIKASSIFINLVFILV